MYESPVELFDVANFAKKVNEETDNYIYEYIVKLGINVNKEELIKALQYDRDQYEKGYKDGLKATDWHPYPKEKPTEEGYYLCTVTDCPYRVHTFWYIDEDDGFGERLNGWKITAWAELPESYKGDDEE